MRNTKIFFALTVLFLISFSAEAQRTADNFFLIQNQNAPASNLRNVIDTIMPISFIPASEGGLGCFTGIYSSDSGYVSGNNAYGDSEKAQFYGLAAMGYADTGAIQSVLVKFAYKTQNASPEEVVAKIYSADTSGFKPFMLLGTSQPVNISSITASGGYTFFLFDVPVQVSDSFFVSVQLARDAGDTLVILSTQDDCVQNSGWSWEQWKDGTWHSILASWVRDIDLAIFPVVDLPFSSGITSSPENIQVKVYPNPASNFVNVQLPAESASQVSIRILSVEGNVVRQFCTPKEKLSNHSMLLSLDRIPSSFYFIEIEKGEITWRIPLCVVK